MFTRIALDAEIHREVYASILVSLLKQPGSKRKFAEKLNITPQYLSYLCNPSYLPPKNPSPALAKRIVEALPLDKEQKEALFNHIILSNRRRIKNQLQTDLTNQSVDKLLEEIALCHTIATYNKDPQLTKINYRGLRQASKILIEKLNPKFEPLIFAQVCMFLHDASCVLNRPDEGLYYAKLARSRMEYLDIKSHNQNKEQFGHLLLNAIVAEGLAYQNLGLFNKASEVYLQAKDMKGIGITSYAFWEPHIYRNQVKSLVLQPRFIISDAEALAKQAQRIFENRNNQLDQIDLYLTDISLSKAYIRHGSKLNLKKANNILLANLSKVDYLLNLGSLHRVMLLKELAMLRWIEGDKIEWEFFIQKTLEIAFNAGLEHQVKGIKGEYFII